MKSPNAPTGLELEIVIGRVLAWGTLASSTCLAVGLFLSLLGGHERFAGMALTAGILLLLATPVGRVVASIVEYVRQRDWVFAILTSVVLLELAMSALAAR